ncbi:MAG: ubiquitin-like domain-containing protein [Anaerolineae bacterium]|nr:ubiquitin-like domain-containing protein [Anaerolineae bacterium]
MSLRSLFAFHPEVLARGAATLAALAFVGFLLAGYHDRLTPVTLVVDGTERRVWTHQDTVGGLLADRGFALGEKDWVSHALNHPLRPGMTIEVRRARPVLVRADGHSTLVWTHNPQVQAALGEAGVSLRPGDEVHTTSCDQAIDIPACQNSDAPVLIVEVRRAVPVTLHEDGRTLRFTTTASTVGQALERLGLNVYLADRVQPDLGHPVSAGMHIYIDRSRPVTVEIDGKRLRTRTHRSSVGEVLADLGIVLVGQDYTDPPPDAPLSEETIIRVVRVAEEFQIQQEPIPFQTRWQPDPDLEIDHRRVLQEGTPGLLQRRWRVRYENGVEVSRTLENEYVAVPPTDKIIGYGTKIIVRQLETPEGTVEYWRVIRMLATSYSASTAGVPRSSPYYGRTRLGLPMRRGIVAVDPRVIPLGSRVYVPGYGVGLAADTGGAIKGRRIDLGYNDEDLVLWYRWVNVYLLTPVPPPERINYILE